MIQQHIHTRKPSFLQGLGIIFALFAGFIVVVLVLTAMIERTGISYLSYGVFVYAIVAGIYLMRKYILEYRYTLNEGVLYFERLYGKQSRVLAQVPVRKIVAFADENTVMDKYKSRIESTSEMVLPVCDLPHMAIVYRGETAVFPCIVFQPNEELKNAVAEALKSADSPFEA